MKVFLSYSRRDAEFVDRLDSALAVLGYEIWMDRRGIDAPEDESWRASVVNAIHDSDVFVLVLSPNSTKSKNVGRELELAADSTRIVPVLLEECEQPPAFQYVLQGVQYIDFTAYEFDEGVARLATRLGHGQHPVPVPPPPPPPRWWIAAAAAAVGILVIGTVVFAITRSNDDGEGSGASPTGSAGSSMTSSASTPTGSPAAADPTQQDAEAVVTAWAAATSRRDLAEAARIDPSHSAEFLEMLYGSVDDPIRMMSVQPFVVRADRDGSSWTLTGAAVAWDFDPEPNIRTHVICSVWIVDTAAGTAEWTTGADAFFADEQIPVEQFPDAYASTCT